MRHSLADFYYGRRVLVTGHTGFQGGWAVAFLKVLGAQVFGYGLPPVSRPNFFDATLLEREITSIFGDVRDRNSLANAFAEFQPEIVLHCAFRSNPEFARREPVETFSTNVMGTVNILEEARLTPSVGAVVMLKNCSREEGIGRSADKGICVRDASMTSAELARSALLYDGRTAVASACGEDAIGGGDWGEGRIVPNLVRSLTVGEPIEIKDSLLPAWHVLDLTRACLLLGQGMFESGQKYAGHWDFLPRDECRISAKQVAKDFVKFWDTPESESELDTATQQSMGLDCENDKARAQLNWSEVLSAAGAIHWAAEWYRAYYTDSSLVPSATERQIERYIESIVGCAEV